MIPKSAWIMMTAGLLVTMAAAYLFWAGLYIYAILAIVASWQIFGIAVVEMYKDVWDDMLWW